MQSPNPLSVVNHMPSVSDAAQGDPAPRKDNLPLQVVDHACAQTKPARRWRRWGIGIVIAIVAAATLTFQMIASGRANEQAVAERVSAMQADAVPTVVGLASLQPRDGVSLVGLPSGAGDARISQLMVAVGDSVTPGQTLAHVDTEPKLIAAIARARADVALKVAERARTRAAIQFEQEGAKATYAVSQVIAANAKVVSDRAATLAQTNAMTIAQRDDLIVARQQADGELEKARVNLARYSGAPDMHPDVVAADAAVGAARAALAAAETDLDQAILKSPVAGRILSITTRAGERPGTEGILRLADTTAMVAEVEVFQTRIHAVSMSDPVTLTSEALVAPLRGTVTAIGAEVLPQGEISDDAAANTNARVIMVTVTLDAASTNAAQSMTNLQVLATIAVGTGT
jgi:HlyD family secretion protein